MKRNAKEMKELRFPDPKIVPRPEEAAYITFEFTKEELSQVKQAIREGGYWSFEEFARAAVYEFLEEHRARRDK